MQALRQGHGPGHLPSCFTPGCESSTLRCSLRPCHGVSGSSALSRADSPWLCRQCPPRYSTAGGFLQELGRWRRGRGISPRSTILELENEVHAPAQLMSRRPEFMKHGISLANGPHRSWPQQEQVHLLSCGAACWRKRSGSPMARGRSVRAGPERPPPPPSSELKKCLSPAQAEPH